MLAAVAFVCFALIHNSQQCKPLKRGFPRAERQIILQAHNDLRSMVAQGRQRGLPPAANMRELEWDNALARKAQAHADNCVFEHDSYEDRRTAQFQEVGQNLHKHFDAVISPLNWTIAVKSWYYKEVNKFRKSQIKPFEFVHKAGHFTQVVWAETFKVGCGYTQFDSKKLPYNYVELYTCNYGPGGNAPGEAMYEKGSACSKCPKRTRCNRRSGLCKSTTRF